MKCKRCGRALKSSKNIELGYGSKCFKIIQLQESLNKPSNALIELKNSYNQLSLKLTILERKVAKFQEKAISNIDSIERTTQITEIQNTPERINFTIVIQELKMIFKGENFNYHEILRPINPRTEIEISPVVEKIKVFN